MIDHEELGEAEASDHREAERGAIAAEVRYARGQSQLHLATKKGEKEPRKLGEGEAGVGSVTNAPEETAISSILRDMYPALRRAKPASSSAGMRITVTDSTAFTTTRATSNHSKRKTRTAT